MTHPLEDEAYRALELLKPGFRFPREKRRVVGHASLRPGVTIKDEPLPPSSEEKFLSLSKECINANRKRIESLSTHSYPYHLEEELTTATRRKLLNYLCEALKTLGGDLFRSASAVIPVLMTLFYTGVIKFSLPPLAIAFISLIIGRVGISVLCSDALQLKLDENDRKRFVTYLKSSIFSEGFITENRKFLSHQIETFLEKLFFAYLGIEEIWLFGSRAAAKAKNKSDWYLLIFTRTESSFESLIHDTKLMRSALNRKAKFHIYMNYRDKRRFFSPWGNQKGEHDCFDLEEKKWQIGQDPTIAFYDDENGQGLGRLIWDRSRTKI